MGLINMDKQKKFPISAVIKPTKACNLRCTYCYEKDKTGKKMSDSTLEKVISQVIEYNYQICRAQGYDKSLSEFIWHGGEPLLMGKEFYRKVRDLQRKYTEKYDEHIIRNGIQTNLTLLNQEYLDFLKNEGFALGSSVDGTKEMHDSTRVYKKGRGTFDDVMGSVNLIKRNNPKDNLGVIVVLTKDKIDRLEELYFFFKSNQINFEVNYPAIVGDAVKNRDSLEVSPKEWGEAINKLFDLWFYDTTEPFIEIPLLTKYAVGAITGVISYCSFSGTCRDRYISIDPGGDIYPCGKFGSEAQFKLGNINTDSLEQVMNGEVQRHLASRSVEKIEECKECEYKKICNAGCMYNAFLSTGDALQKDPLCEAYKIIYPHIKSKVEEEIKKLDPLSVE